MTRPAAAAASTRITLWVMFIETQWLNNYIIDASFSLPTFCILNCFTSSNLHISRVGSQVTLLHSLFTRRLHCLGSRHTSGPPEPVQSVGGWRGGVCARCDRCGLVTSAAPCTVYTGGLHNCNQLYTAHHSLYTPHLYWWYIFMLEDSEARDFKQLHGMPSEDLEVSCFPSALFSSVTFRLGITWKKY